MTEQQADLFKRDLTERLKVNFNDISISFDIFNEKELLVIHLFWNRISKTQWQNSKRFNCEIDNYNDFLESTIIPFMNKQIE